MYYSSRSTFTSSTLVALFSVQANVFAKTEAFINLSEIARLYSMHLRMHKNKIILANKYNTLEFEIKGRRSWINGSMFWLHKPSQRLGRSWCITKEDFNFGIDPILRSYTHLSKRLPKIIVIDPGHGGKDSGAIGSKRLQEKQVVLDISHKIKKGLELHGFKVILTRYDDSYPSLEDRIVLTKKVKADLFLSIHADGATSESANGVETFISTLAGFDSSNHYGENGDKSIVSNNRFNAENAILGFAIQSNLLKTSKRSDRGVRRARFFVTRNAPCPAALIECGFLTNLKEEKLLSTESYRSNVSYGIVNGIRAYRTLVSRAED